MFFHGSAYISSENYLFFRFLYSFYCAKMKKNIVEENSENDEEHNDENEENYDYITDRSFEASRLL